MGSPATETRLARVLVVDDQTTFLAVLRELLCATRELEAIGEADSGERGIEAVQESRPDIVLMDVWMPGKAGMGAVKAIKLGWLSTIVVLVSTTHPDELGLGLDGIAANAVVWKRDPICGCWTILAEVSATGPGVPA